MLGFPIILTPGLNTEFEGGIISDKSSSTPPLQCFPHIIRKFRIEAKKGS
jgi:hypothetical protein